MTTIAKISVSAAILSAMGLLSQSAVSADTTGKAAQMLPGKALELEIGGQHAISYFEPGQDGCGLTVVLATGKEGQGGVEAHGTRVVIPLAPGKTVRIDGTERRSADFVCGAKGQEMSARVYDREPYKAAAANSNKS